MWPLIRYQDQQDTLRLGGGLTALQLAAMDAGQARAEDQLGMAASLSVSGNSVRITNLTGHKLITGYPEGRRMWLNVKWYDASDQLVGEDGAYGPLGVIFTNPVSGLPFEPQSVLDLESTKVYEVHPAITQEWAQTLMAVDPTHYGPIPLGYDRLTGAPVGSIAELASGGLGPAVKTFHFVLNDHVNEDTRIPPYGMDRETARVRNALPVPTSQYGGGAASYDGLTDVYEYWDDVPLVPPSPEAVRAELTLYYQGTSWEYVLFLWKANNGTDPAQGGNAFLGNEGIHMLDAWINADPAAPMVPPFVMATASWPACDPQPEICGDGLDNDCDGLVDCEDVADCGIDPFCCVAEPEVCDDGADNDCDGSVDCHDAADCSEAPVCQIDCGIHADKASCSGDPSCEWQGSPKNGMCVEIAACVPTAPDEIGACADGIDNDCDGLVDCSDALDCGDDPACLVDCSVYTTRNLCNNQATCRWDNKAGLCLTR
jgi:hypothetical protein